MAKGKAGADVGVQSEVGLGEQIISEWFKTKGWQQFPFQKEMEAAYLAG